MDDERWFGGPNDTSSANGSAIEEQSAEKAQGYVKDSPFGGENERAEGAETVEPDDGEGAPEVYEHFSLEYADGGQYDEGLHEAFVKVAKDSNLNQQQAQQFVSFYEQTLVEMSQKQVEAFNDERKQVLDNLRADREFGGENFNTSVSGANQMLRKFDPTNAIAEKLQARGYVTDADLVPLLARMKAVMSDDILENSPSGVTGSASIPDHEKIGWTYK